MHRHLSTENTPSNAANLTIFKITRLKSSCFEQVILDTQSIMLALPFLYPGNKLAVFLDCHEMGLSKDYE